MKKVVAILTIFILLTCSNSIVFAANDVSTLSNDLNVILDKSWKSDSLDSKSVLYHGFNDKKNLELGIFETRNYKTNREHSWSNYSKEELSYRAEESIKSQKESSPTKISDYSLYENEQLKFIAFAGTVTNDDNQTKNFLQYITVYNGGTIQICFYSDKKFNNAQLKVAEDFVRTCEFNKTAKPSIDRSIIIKLILIVIVIILLILSLVWNIRRYRKKGKNHV